MLMKIVWENGVPRQVPSTLKEDLKAGKFKAVLFKEPPPPEHKCKFCPWEGDEKDFYAHWFTNHRRAAL